MLRKVMGTARQKKDKKGYGHRGEKQLEQSENGGPLGLLQQGEGGEMGELAWQQDLFGPKF